MFERDYAWLFPDEPEAVNRHCARGGIFPADFGLTA
jgi:hypothetical protein